VIELANLHFLHEHAMKGKYIATILIFFLAITVRSVLHAETITSAEYFIDVDPGEGNGTTLKAKDGAFDESTEEVETFFNTEGLSIGTHTVYVRFKDSNGQWGPKRGITFTVGTVAGKYITAAEYFIDADPGESNGTPLQATDGIFDEATEKVEAVFNTSEFPLSPGKHTLYVRMKDSEGKWGPKKQATFEMGPLAPLHITTAEYFIDNDPGEGNGIPLQAKDGAFDGPAEEVKATFSTTELSPGKHNVYIRMKDSEGKWGEVKGQTFTILEGVIAKGDVNGDGDINILDIVKVVNHIIERVPLTGDEFLYADVAPFDESGQPGGDGTVDILDIVGIVNMILYPGPHTNPAKIALSKPAISHPAIIRLSDKESGILSLDVEFEIPISGLQIRLSYDPGKTSPQKVITTERSKAMNLSWSAGNGKLIALLYSPDGKTIPPGNKSVLKIEGIGEGNSFVIEQVILSNPHANRVPVQIETAPQRYTLFQNYPNPTNAGTTIRYTLPEKGRVRLAIYSITGQLIKILVNREEEPGYRCIYWDGRDEKGREIPSGVYLYRLKTEKFETAKKMLILK